ncbi:MAG: PA14 domain-containing protein, partial [Myxococcota bacterium]|nr:PA14 domain-containing protein [Myxococcota bacterium]
MDSTLRFRRLVGSIALVMAWTTAGCESTNPGEVPDESVALDASNLETDDTANSESGEPVDVDVSVLWPSLSEGYRDGGLLATYVSSAGIQGIEDVPLSAPPSHLQQGLSIDSGDPAFSDMLEAGPFGMLLQGALHIEETGVYRLAMVTDGLAELRLDGFTLMSLVDDAETQATEMQVQLEAGWHPIDIRYVRGFYGANLFVFFAPEGELVAPLEADRLGYKETPPAGTPALEGHTSEEFIWSHGARYGFVSTTPARLRATCTVDGEEIEVFSGGAAGLQGSVSVPLMPDEAYEVTLQLVDVWDRTLEGEVVEVSTPTTPPYASGAILGSYYAGQNFQTLMDQRLDPQVNFPNPTSGNAGQNFSTTLPNNGFSVRWEGAIWISDSGHYTFYLGTNDGGRMVLDGEEVIDNWINHSFVSFESVTRELHWGWHTLEVEMYEANGEAAARLDWEGPDFSRSLVPPHRLAYIPPSQGPEPPEVISFQLNGNDDGVTVTYSASKLV